MLFQFEILFIQLYSISELKTQSSLKIDFEKYIVYIVSFKFHFSLFSTFYKPNILYIHVVPLIFFPFRYHSTIVILTKSSNQSKKISYYKNILLVPVIIHPLIVFTVYNNRTFYSTDQFFNAFQTNSI